MAQPRLCFDGAHGSVTSPAVRSGPEVRYVNAKTQYLGPEGVGRTYRGSLPDEPILWNGLRVWLVAIAYLLSHCAATSTAEPGGEVPYRS